MGAFVDTSKIDVWDDARENVIWIKRRMDFGTKSRVEDTLTQMAVSNGRAGELRFSIGAQKLALAVHNIVGWDGPDFVDPTTKRTIPCSADAIERLDPAYPLLLRAQEKIDKLNTAVKAPDGSTPDPNA